MPLGQAVRATTLFALLALIAAGCGSTVPPTQQAASQRATGADEFGPSVDAEIAEGSSEPSATAASGTRTATAARTAGSNSTAALAAKQPTGEIVVGAYGARIGLQEGDIGITGIALGNNVTQFEAMAKWINAHGGLGGRKMRLVIATQDVTGDSAGQDRATQDQGACSKFTEDNKVVAVVSHASATEAFYGCLANKGVIHIANTSTASSAANFAKFNGRLFASAPTQDRVAATLADELARAGYFADKPMKLGVFRFDHAWWADAAKVFRERAAKYGVTVAEESAACQGCSDSGAQHQAAILRFATMGITHVVMFGDANLTLQFMIQASTQGFRPRYGLSSYNAPQLLATNQGGQLQRAVGIGFEPALDVDKPQEPPPTPADALCRKIMTDDGQPPEDSRFELAQAHHTCEGLFLLKAVLDRHAALQPASFSAGLEGLGTTYQPVLTFATQFGPGRHVGASAYRPLAFISGCSCFTYTGGLMPMSGHG